MKKEILKPVVVLTILWFSLQPLFGQVAFTRFYGKNKVQYSRFNWKILPTEHFQLYFYHNNEDELKLLAHTAESAYRKLSGLLKHELQDRVPLIYYSTYTDFEQTNLFQVSEGVLGVAEPVLHRIAIHGDLPPDELQSLIEHELAHIFQFDFLWGRQEGALYSLRPPPLWAMEGLSEYVTGRWSAWSSLIVRDAVLNDRLPEFDESGELFSRFPLPRDPAYDFGHALYEFIEERYGPNAINEFWRALKHYPRVSLFTRGDLWKRAFGLNLKEFSQAFRRYLRDKHRHFLLRENPADYSIALGPEFPINPFYFTFSAALSPSGELAAVLTYNVRRYDLNIVLVSVRDGRILKNLTPGFTTRYQSIKFQIDPSYGRSLAWSRDGKWLAFFARRGYKYSLVLMDPYSGKIRRQMKILQDEPASPSFHPDGEYLFYTAFEGGRRDLFRLKLKSGQVENLTSDRVYEKAVSCSPDGRWLLQTIRDDGRDFLVLSPVEEPVNRKRLSSKQENAICPEFSADSQTVFFSSDRLEAFNLYSLHFPTGLRKRYTNVQTGNFFPSPVPGSKNLLVFCAFNKGSFQLFRAELEGEPEEETIGPSFESTKSELQQQAEAFPLDQEAISHYRGLNKLYLTRRPPVDLILTSDGSFFGSSTLAFSDILSDQNFLLSLTQFREFRSYQLAYLNQKRRLQYLISAFDYSIFYYPPLYYYDPALYEYLTYQDAMAVRSFRGLNLSAFYPFSIYYRAEFGLGFIRFEERFLNPAALGYFGRGRYGFFLQGNYLSAYLSMIGETTFFKEFGPLAGHTFRLGVEQALPLTKNYLSNTTLTADLRKYFFLGGDTLIAVRWEGFFSRGRTPFVFYWGGNNQVRSANFFSIVGNEGWYLNTELRFPLIHQALTILGVLGPVRGSFFLDFTRARLKGYPALFYDYVIENGQPVLKAYEAIGSLGYGFQVFFLGLPFHFDLVRPLAVEKISDLPNIKATDKIRLRFWIGFDF